jgi:dipeptidyl aminopeptidase/acylaminoacyl peptidase
MTSPFQNMTDVGKKKKPTLLPHQNRTPLIFGALGCLLLLLCLCAAGAGWLFLQNKTLPFTNIPNPIGLPSSPSTLPFAGSGSSARIAFSVERGDRPEDKYIWLMKSDGSGARQIIERASSPAFSPDGTKLAYYHWSDGIYVANVDGTNARKILGETNAKYLAWSHDGKWVAFASQPIQKEGVNVNIDAIRPDGSDRRTIVVGGSQPSWSTDDKQIVFSTCRGADCGIFIASSLGGDGGTKVIWELASNPAWSPDGKKIAYQAEADGVKQLYAINPDGTGKKQLTTGAAIHVGAQWSPDGSALYYRSTEGGIWSIWRMNVDGSSPLKLAHDLPAVDWAYERIAVIK